MIPYIANPPISAVVIAAATARIRATGGIAPFITAAQVEVLHFLYAQQIWRKVAREAGIKGLLEA